MLLAKLLLEQTNVVRTSVAKQMLLEQILRHPQNQDVSVSKGILSY
jgi:hypothetical protein